MTKKKLILLVEPDAKERKLLAKIIQFEDGVYDVVTAADANSALPFLANPDRKPDLIVSEYNVTLLPRTFFLQCTSLKIPTVCMTSSPQSAKDALAAARLPVAVVAKPCDPYRLLKSIDLILSTNLKDFGPNRPSDFDVDTDDHGNAS
jgi:DNA-binding NtrC family response regulator